MRRATIEVGGFCMGRPRQTARATVSSGKLENRLSLPMENPKLPHGLDRVLSCSCGAVATDNRLRKTLIGLCPVTH
jgi:hypothetical protein